MTGAEVKQQASTLAIGQDSPPSRQGTPFGGAATHQEARLEPLP